MTFSRLSGHSPDFLFSYFSLVFLLLSHFLSSSETLLCTYILHCNSSTTEYLYNDDDDDDDDDVLVSCGRLRWLVKFSSARYTLRIVLLLQFQSISERIVYKLCFLVHKASLGQS